MKKLIAMVLALVLLAMGFAGCGTDQTTDQTAADSSKKLQVVATIFPGYDFAKQVCGENAEVTMLLPPGSESHSYEPTPQDIITIQNCDLFIYVGGESDAWVDGILESMDTPVNTVRMMDCVETVEEETVEGMEAEEDTAEDGAEEEAEYDEHVWTSPKNAETITESIADKLCEIDADNSTSYQANCDDYVAQLADLDQSFADFFATVSNKLLIFGDRFPLRYFVEEYGLKYYAAFPGCSTDTEPSAATVAFLIDKVEEDQVGTVFYIEFSNHTVADSIAEATGAKTALFQTCHNVSQEDMDSGATYVSIMRQNLETLKGAMS